jgi:hypothetical protein
VPHRINATVNPEQGASSQSLVYAGPRGTDPQQLIPRDESVLSARDRRNALIER